MYTIETLKTLLLLMAYTSWTLPCPPLIARPSPGWFAFFHADERPIFSGLKSASIAHIARCGWVFLSVASSSSETSGLLMWLNGDDLHLVTADDVAKEVQSSIGYGMREMLATRDVSDFKFNVGHHGGCKVCGGSSEWPTCQTHQWIANVYFFVDYVSHPYSKTGTTYVW